MSEMTRPASIKVVYFGKCGGFFRGKVLEAKAKSFVRVNRKWEPCNYRIEDDEGDYFTVSKDGEKFEKGWQKV